MEAAVDFAGKRILVVEDDYLLARDICDRLKQSGATVIGPAPTAFYALSLVGRRPLDGAILDIRLFGADVFELADALWERSVPMVFASAYGQESIPQRHHAVPRLTKPYDDGQLMQLMDATIKAPPRPGPRLPHPIATMRPVPPIDRMPLAVVRALKCQ